MKARLALVTLVACIGCVTPALAQNTYQQQIAAQFASLAPVLSQRGFTPVGERLVGSLNREADESILVSLTAGTHYVIVGACDNDCTDVDLQVFSSDGTKLGEDMETDDKPVVEITPSATGQYRVKVLMAACTTNPCYYGVQLFSGAAK
jgi:hypothetical protein